MISIGVVEKKIPFPRGIRCETGSLGVAFSRQDAIRCGRFYTCHRGAGLLLVVEAGKVSGLGTW